MEEKTVSDKIHVEELLAGGDRVQLSPQGYSMHPFLTPGRDSVVLEGSDGILLRRGDVVLYRRDSGLLVLHRICKIKKDGIYLVGDNQYETEGPLRRGQVKGIVREFIRKGRKHGTGYLPYVCYWRLWLACLPLRPVIFRMAGLAGRKKKKGRK